MRSRSRTVALPKPSPTAKTPPEAEQQAFGDYRRWVQQHYDGLPGA